MSLRRHFVGASCAITLLTLGGAFGAVWASYTGEQQERLDTILLSEARADAIEAAFTHDVTRSGYLVLRMPTLGAIAKSAVVYGADGAPLEWTMDLEQGQPRVAMVRRREGQPFDFWWNNEHWRATWSALPDASGRSLLLTTPRTDLDRRAALLATRMAAAALLGTLASAIGSFWVARLLTRHHVHIARVARAVAAGDLSARVATPTEDPETAQLGRDIDEMIARMATLVEKQRQFIADASHELRSPVTTLLGELSLALRRERDAAAYRAAIAEALDSTRRLKNLTEDLLTLARIGASELATETVSLPDIARSALSQSKPAADSQGVTFEVVFEASTVRGRSGDLERLVRNLLENAIRHSPPGGCIRVESRSVERDACIVVSDEGPGVPTEVRERIFEPFFRLPFDRADASGCGLGLAIGRRIARAHGGDVWLEDHRPDVRGARFVVRLPALGPLDRTRPC